MRNERREPITVFYDSQNKVVFGNTLTSDESESYKELEKFKITTGKTDVHMKQTTFMDREMMEAFIDYIQSK